MSRAPVLVGRLHELECGAGPVSIGHRANQPARKVARKAEERLDEAAELLLELGDVLELPHARSSVRRLSRVVAKVQRRTAFIRELQEPRKPEEGNDD
ncbi:MAG TPA: hypothetical protein RMF84_01300 [Polyangiaceae bacterium LLY-WYZ-14_1]|nr:hypothetical protein [Polyangiaceae bacterium LLY-WYZ-14_1]